MCCSMTLSQGALERGDDAWRESTAPAHSGDVRVPLEFLDLGCGEEVTAVLSVVRETRARRAH